MAMVQPIINQQFDKMQFIFDRIGFQRYGVYYVAPTIIRPTTYDFTTEEDFLKQIAEAVESGAPPMTVRMIMIRYLKSVYFSEEKAVKILDLLIKADRLLEIGKEEIQIKLANKTIAKWEDYLHFSGLTLIDKLLFSDEAFLDKPIQKQIEELQALAKVESKKIEA